MAHFLTYSKTELQMIKKIKQIKIMKNLKVITLAIAILGFSAASFAQSTATALAVPASATILTPISISLKNDGLRFGTIVTNGAAGDVVIGSTGAADRSLGSFTEAGSIGATLTVGANQDPGVYTGTYIVTVQYN